MSSWLMELAVFLIAFVGILSMFAVKFLIPVLKEIESKKGNNGGKRK